MQDKFHRLLKQFVPVALASVLLTACGGLPSAGDLNPLGWFGGDEDEEDKDRLEGERVSVLSLERQLEVDPAWKRLRWFCLRLT